MISTGLKRDFCRLTGMFLWGWISLFLSPARADTVTVRLDRTGDKFLFVLVWSGAVDFEHAATGRELWLRFGRPIEISGLDHLPNAAPDWIESVSSGYDTLLLRAARDVEYTVQSADKEIVVRFHPSSRWDERAGREEKRAQLRLDLLEARWNSDTGNLADAAHLLGRLATEYPGDPDVLTSLANLESQLGRWRRAGELYNRVLQFSPDDEEVTEARARLLRDQGTQAEAEFVRKTVADSWQELMMRSTGQILFDNYLRAGIVYDYNTVKTGIIRRADGRVEAYDGTRHRAEVYLRHHLERGAQIAGSLFLNDQNQGFGVELVNPDIRGQTKLRMDYHRPYWEFVEGLVDGGVRDRIEAEREQRLSPRLNGWLAGAMNRCGVQGVGGAARSIGINGGLNYLVTKSPAIFLQYGFDGEYRTAIRSLTDSSGARYYPIPLLSREVHAADLAVGGNITRYLRADGFAGYAVDRLGGTGPYLGMRFSANLSKTLGAQMDFDRRLNSINTGEAVNRLTCRVTWKMGN